MLLLPSFSVETHQKNAALCVDSLLDSTFSVVMVDQEAEASATLLLLLLTLLFLPFQAFQNKTRTVDQLIHINIQQC